MSSTPADKRKSSSNVSLRRSCHFCRTRKIRCSGDTNGVCSACRARGGDCIFNAESTKGRPRRSVSGPVSTPKTPSDSRLPAELKHQHSEPIPHRHCASSGTIGEDLAALCGDYAQSTTDDVLLDPWQRSMIALREKAQQKESNPSESDGFVSPWMHPKSRLPSDRLLGLIAQDLVCMLADQLGRLGCEEEEPGLRFFSSCQNQYTAMTADPGTLQLGSHCMSKIHDQFRFQLVEMWFNMHPLSMVVSKTLFLRSYKDGQHDEALLAVIIAGAQHSYRGGEFVDTEAQLFEYAEALLSDRSKEDWDLPTAQVVLLLGWHELCVKRTHKAAYLIAYAGKIAAHLQQAMAGSTCVPKGRANGVDIDTVEAEVIRNIYWVTFAITLWAYMEVREPFAAMLPNLLPPDFPAVDETQSTIIELDVASDNVSTFHSQARVIRGLWPLAHIASTIGHIYALYPENRDRRISPATGSWQFRPLHQLRGLLRQNEERESLCQNVQRVLKDAVENMEREVRNDVSKALVSAAYLVLVIHLEFPRSDDGYHSELNITSTQMQRFYQAASTLAQIITRVVTSRTSTWLLCNTPIDSSTTAPLVQTFSSGLDIVSRATSYLISTAQAGTVTQRQALLPYLSRLGDLTNCLYLAAKEDALRWSRKTRIAKKLLKATCTRIAEMDCKLGIQGSDRRSKSGSTASAPSELYSWTECSSIANQPTNNSAGHSFHAKAPGSKTASVTTNTIDGEQYARLWAHTDAANLCTTQDVHLMQPTGPQDQAQSHTFRTELSASQFWNFALQEQQQQQQQTNMDSVPNSDAVAGAATALRPESQEFDISMSVGGHSPTSSFFGDMDMLEQSDITFTDAAWDSFQLNWQHTALA